MKKSLIAGAGVAAFAFAAVPFAGVFAAQTGSVKDTVQLTVDETCQMAANASEANYDLSTKTAGQAYEEKTGSAMTITCNAIKGWTLKATATSLEDAAEAKTTSQTIPFGAYGTSSSVWSAKVALSGNNTPNATITTGWDNYEATSASDTTIVKNVADTTGAKAVSGLIITPTYKAYAAADQAAATYKGTITYTFAKVN